jgi:hypothetical protein
MLDRRTSAISASQPLPTTTATRMVTTTATTTASDDPPEERQCCHALDISTRHADAYAALCERLARDLDN